MRFVTVEHVPVPENLTHRTRPPSDYKGRATALIRERRFRDLILGVTDYAIYMIDLDGTVTNWNAGAERAKGYRVDEAVGQHFSRFFTAEDQAAGHPAQALDAALKTGSFDALGWRVRKDGSRFWAHSVIDLIKDEDGVPIGFANITKDHSEPQKVQSAELERERRFRHLVESITDYAIYMLDLDGHVSNWNAGAERAKGYKAIEIVGQHFSKFYTAEDRANGLPARALATARSTGSFEAEGWRLRKDGSRFWAHVVIDLVHDDDGIPIGFAKITNDRTEQRKAEAAVLESERRFRHLVQGVTDYAIYMLDLDGIVVNWNAGAERAKGYKAEEIVGQHFSRFYTAEDRAIGLPARGLATALKTGSFAAEGWRVKKDGSRIWANVVIDLIRDDAGTPIGFAKITKDQTEQWKVHAAALESEKRFRHLVQSVTDYAIYMLDLEGIVANWNAGAERAKGYKEHEIVGQHFSRFYTEEDKAQGLPALALEMALTVGSFEAEGWRVRKDGSRIWAHVVIDLICDDGGMPIGFAKITRDISRQKADAERLAQVTGTLEAALSNMKHGLCVFDASGSLKLANRQFLEMFGLQPTTALNGRPFESIVRDVLFGRGESAGDATLFYDRHMEWIGIKSEQSVVEDLPNGMPVAISHAMMPGGGWVSTFEDITERKRADQDSLTGLANRRALRERLDAVAASPHRTRCAVMLLDLDDFKFVNDTYGHAAGDAVLRRVAEIMRSGLRSGDLAARLGGDEFAVFLGEISEAEAVALAERLIAEIRMPHAIAVDVVAHVGVSIGVALTSSDFATDEILMKADVALYDAKESGKSAVRVYSTEMSAKVKARRELEADFRDTVATGEGFALYYQPIMNTETRLVTAREALLRWHHPRQGSVPPSIFMPLAAEMGLTAQLGSWVLDRACHDACLWADGARVTINVSPLELGGNTYANQVIETLYRSALPAKRLEIEITETTLLDDGSDKLDELRRLHAFGVKVALDDFGVGFSSLAHVRAFPFDRIKIEGSFVRDAMIRPECAVIVGIVAELGRRLGIAVVAEGVETPDHLDLAIREGCHEVQGYLIGYPEAMSADLRAVPRGIEVSALRARPG